MSILFLIGDTAAGAPPDPAAIEAPSLAIGFFVVLWRAAGVVILIAALLYFARRPAWTTRVRRGPRMTAIPGLLILALWIVGRIAAGVIAQATGATAEPPSVSAAATAATAAWLLYGLSLPACLAWLYIIRRIERHPPVSPGFSLERKRSVTSAAIVAAAGFAITYPVMGLVAAIGAAIRHAWTGQHAEPVAHLTLQLLNDSPLDWWSLALIIAVVVAAPIIEEVIYRGTFQGIVRSSGLGVWSAVLPVAFIFAIMHTGLVTVEVLPVLFVFGVGLGLVYEWSGRLTAPIVMHALFNLTNIVLLYVAMRGS